MKKRFFAIFPLMSAIFVFLTGCVSMATMPEDERIVEEIIETNKTPEALFVQSNIWLADTFKSAGDVIEYSDKDAGVLLGNGITPHIDFLLNMSGYGYSIRIEVRENRAKIGITATHTYVNSNGYTMTRAVVQGAWDKIIKPGLEEMVASYAKAVNAEGTTW